MSLKEDQLIQWLTQKTQGQKRWSSGFGIGDDGAVLKKSKQKDNVVCSDSLVESIHFDLSSITPQDLGWKSLAVNLSDLAAMGATPKYSFLNLSLPSSKMGGWVRKFLKGYLELSELHRVSLMGGDTTSSPDRVFISVTVIGECLKGHSKLRSTAHAGDVLCVTGNLGDSRAGLFLQTQKWSSVHKKKLLLKHHCPKPRVEEGKWLGAREEVTSMMDISDGLFKDVSRLCRANTLSVQLDPREIPMSVSLKKMCAHFKKNILEEAFLGGEDYELLLTCKSNSLKRLSRLFKTKFKKSLIPIGVMCASRKGKEKVTWVDEQKDTHINFKKSYEHF